MLQSVLRALLIAFFCLTAADAKAACQTTEYTLPGLDNGKLKMAITAFAFGSGILPSWQCLTDGGQTLFIRPNPVLIRSAAPGQVVGHVLLRGSGGYLILFRGVNEGSLSFFVQWPLVMGQSGQIELQPDHPEFRINSEVKQSLSSQFMPLGANGLAFLFRAPTIRRSDDYLAAIEISVSDKALPSIGFATGPISQAIEPRGRSLMTQIRPYVAVKIAPVSR